MYVYVCVYKSTCTYIPPSPPRYRFPSRCPERYLSALSSARRLSVLASRGEAGWKGEVGTLHTLAAALTNMTRLTRLQLRHLTLHPVRMCVCVCVCVFHYLFIFPYIYALEFCSTLIFPLNTINFPLNKIISPFHILISPSGGRDGILPAFSVPRLSLPM